MNSAIDNTAKKIIQLRGAEPPYYLYLTLQDGQEMTLDLTPLIENRAAFWRLKNFRYFRNAGIDPLGGVCWPSGEDIAPCKIFDYAVHKV